MDSAEVCVLCLIALPCPALCNPMDCSPPSSVRGILQAIILEWVAFPFSRGSPQPTDQTQVSHTAGRFFTNGATGEAHNGASFSFGLNSPPGLMVLGGQQHPQTEPIMSTGNKIMRLSGRKRCRFKSWSNHSLVA